MFTFNKISISEVLERIAPTETKLLRDGEICFVGKIPLPLKDRLCACSTEAQIKEANSEADVAGIITTPDLCAAVAIEKALVQSAYPLRTMFQVHDHISRLQGFQWEDFDTEIAENVHIHSSAVVAEKNVRIGAGSTIGPNSVVKERTIIGENSHLDAGVLAGVEAFDLDKTSTPEMLLHQSGGVKIGNNVEILSGCTIVRSTFGGFTKLGNRTKLDCQVHVAHDCILGELVVAAACALFCGRVTVEDNVFIGPNATIRNGALVKTGSFVSMGAVVIADVPENTKVSGNYAIEHKKWLRFLRQATK